MGLLITRLEFWSSTDEYVFTDEHGHASTHTGKEDISFFLADRYGTDLVEPWLVLAHEAGPSGVQICL